MSTSVLFPTHAHYIHSFNMNDERRREEEEERKNQEREKRNRNFFLGSLF